MVKTMDALIKRCESSTEENQSFLETLDAICDASLGDFYVRISSLANAAALLYEYVKDINWVGFYLKHPKMDELMLGPFQGKVACTRITVGKGVCGTAFASKSTQLVPDVHAFEGHIACDSASRSELVVPIFFDGQPVGVLDIDSPVIHRFSSDDAAFIEQAVRVLEAKW